MTPCIYGYANLLPGADAAVIPQVRQTLDEFARDLGFTLMDVFVIDSPSRRIAVWCELRESCEEFGVRNLIVPSLEHLHGDDSLARYVRDDLAHWINGRVWVMAE